MTPENIKSFLEELKQRYVPNGTLELTSLENDDIKLSVSGLPQDTFKVQGKIINSGDEIKKEIATKVEEKFPNSKVTFL